MSFILDPRLYADDWKSEVELLLRHLSAVIPWAADVSFSGTNVGSRSHIAIRRDARVDTVYIEADI